ncbi:MAG: hypothetical protein ACM3QW_00670 [Ignavibacteriales bacterium]
MFSTKMSQVLRSSWKSVMIAGVLSLAITSQAAAWTPDFRVFTQESPSGSSVLMEMANPDGSQSPVSVPLGVNYQSVQVGQVSEPLKTETSITIDFSDLTFTNLEIW